MIARAIVESGGDFVLAVKGNQPGLFEAVVGHFAGQLEKDLKGLKHRCYQTSESGHGRVEERAYFLSRVPADFAPKADWPWVKELGYSVRVTPHADGRQTDEVRYYALSRYLSGERFGQAVRGHWGIEAMHWVLDVNFREDHSRTRERALANNLSWLRRFAVSLLKRHPIKDSLRGKMMRRVLNTDFLAEVLMLQGD